MCSKVWSINIKYKFYVSLFMFCYKFYVSLFVFHFILTIHCLNNVGFFHSYFSSLAANFVHFAVSRLCGSQQLHNWLSQALPNHAGSSNSCFNSSKNHPDCHSYSFIAHSMLSTLSFVSSPVWLPIFTMLHELVMSPKVRNDEQVLVQLQTWAGLISIIAYAF